MRFLHAADLHLGLRVTRFGKATNRKVQEARFEALDKLLAAAIDRAVDFVLIAGDLFDDNHVDATTSRRAFEMLKTAPMPVFVLPGNHDPLTPDSVWERPPWSPLDDANVHVLRKPEPFSPLAGVTLLPCPLVSKTSLADPTAWLPPRGSDDSSLRIGVAHGSVNDREHLPEDDHLIDRQVAQRCGLDYLALGHWHRTLEFRDSRKVVRMAYSGVHEPMRFPRSPDPNRNVFSVGWTPYSNAANAELFDDDGRGKVLLVSVERAGGETAVEPIETGCLEWKDETYRLMHEDDLSRLINQLATRPKRERQLLRLTLEGVLQAKAYLRVDELEGSSGGGVLSRYCWYELYKDKLGVEPTAEEIRELVGDGVLRRVHQAVCSEIERDNTHGDDPAARELAEQSLLVLYRLAQECER